MHRAGSCLSGRIGRFRMSCIPWWVLETSLFDHPPSRRAAPKENQGYDTYRCHLCYLKCRAVCSQMCTSRYDTALAEPGQRRWSEAVLPSGSLAQRRRRCWLFHVALYGTSSGMSPLCPLAFWGTGGACDESFWTKSLSLHLLITQGYIT